jgi:hypothetical protein
MAVNLTLYGFGHKGNRATDDNQHIPPGAKGWLCAGSA